MLQSQVASFATLQRHLSWPCGHLILITTFTVRKNLCVLSAQKDQFACLYLRSVKGNKDDVI
jgi:hypothetical protein